MLTLLLYIQLLTVTPQTLIVEINNLETAEGIMRLAVYDQHNFLSKTDYVLTHSVAVEQLGTVSIEIELPHGEFALSVYQDINGDGILNTNFFGIPSEPYGFSNNGVGKFGPPEFSEVKFNSSDQRRLSIDLN